MPPPRARDFVVAHLSAFDDEALRTFLAPGDWGVDHLRLGRALQGCEYDELAERILRVLPTDLRQQLGTGRTATATADEVDRSRRHVVNRLFWALLYWHDPGGYDELVAAEHIHPDLLETLPLSGRVVADIGAGAGRFTLFAARHARRVVAIDAVPQLLERLGAKAAALGLHNIELRRGSFLALPLADASVDVAVACSSLTSHAPWGGEGALREARRIVRPGGQLIVIWPDDPSWFCDRGFSYVSVPGEHVMHFADLETAERVCRDFYSDDAAQWVREQRTTTVPFSVLGLSPPSDACVLRVEPTSPNRPYDEAHPHPGIELH
jgi:ubiquinone/menaquinone biosynthesis C-methylase UbiE